MVFAVAYLTFEEQIKLHLRFLLNEGLHVDELIYNGNFIRCHPIGESQEGRGGCAYKSWVNQMRNGYVGIETWARGSGGKTATYKTYGRNTRKTPLTPETPLTSKKHHIGAEREKARLYFEVHSFEEGSSKYLKVKNIKPYGVKFHKSDRYGTALVVPARGVDGEIYTCQNINEDGSKRWLSGRSARGAFHSLTALKEARIIGICEGYATAATCAEALEEHPIAIVCAFDAANLLSVGKSIRAYYPEAKIWFLSDNDRHLVHAGLENSGLKAARIASNEVGGASGFVTPCFSNQEALKCLSDWNDLAREYGLGEVRTQILSSLSF